MSIPHAEGLSRAGIEANRINQASSRGDEGSIHGRIPSLGHIAGLACLRASGVRDIVAGVLGSDRAQLTRKGSWAGPPFGERR